MANGMLDTFFSAGSETREADSPNILLFQRLKDQFNQEALGNIRDSSRLKFYSLLKTETGRMERYLTDITNITHRTELTRLRLSSHSLHIETGRHTATQRENRTCTFCRTNATEDEVHFLVRCPMYNDIRTEYLPQTLLTESIPDSEKAIKILKTLDINSVSKFVHELFKHRGIMSDSLATLDNMLDKVGSIVASDQKIESEAAKTLSSLLSDVLKSESFCKVSNYDDKSLKMTIDIPDNIFKVRNFDDKSLKMTISIPRL